MERWRFLFQIISIFVSVPQDAGGLKKVFEAARTDQLNEEEVSKYNRTMLSENEKKKIGDYAFQQGRKEGIEKEREIIAAKLLAGGFSKEDILRLTGFSLS